MTAHKRMVARHKQSRREQGLVYGPYHKWIGTLPCLVAGLAGHKCWGRVRGHHVEHAGNGGLDFGNEVPLCDGAHTHGPFAIHGVGMSRGRFNEHYGVNIKTAAKHLGGEWCRKLQREAQQAA